MTVEQAAELCTVSSTTLRSLERAERTRYQRRVLCNIDRGYGWAEGTCANVLAGRQRPPAVPPVVLPVAVGTGRTASSNRGRQVAIQAGVLAFAGLLQEAYPETAEKVGQLLNATGLNTNPATEPSVPVTPPVPAPPADFARPPSKLEQHTFNLQVKQWAQQKGEPVKRTGPAPRWMCLKWAEAHQHLAAEDPAVAWFIRGLNGRLPGLE
jgi:hypothetical protein